MRAQLTAEVAEFAAQREEVMTASDEELQPIVEDALDEYRNGVADWYDAPIEAAAVLWWETFEYEQGRAPTATELAQFQSVAADVLDRTSTPTEPTDPAQIAVITGWLSAYALNSATAAGGGALEWVTRQDGDVRESHVPLDGEAVQDGGTFNVAGHELHFPGEPVGPPHVWINCVVGSTEVDWPGQRVLAATRRQYSGPLVEIGTADGHHLTITPNHPVLTPTGYVPAGHLRPGDQVLAASSTVAPQDPDVPAGVEEFYRAASQLRVPSRVRGSGVDFHGDGADSEVEVVGTDGDLALEVRRQVREPALVGAYRAPSPLKRVGLEGRTWVPTDLDRSAVPGAIDPLGRVGSQSVLSPLDRRHAAHAQAVRLADPAYLEAELAQRARDRAATDADFPAHLHDALARGMAACEVVEVKRSTGGHWLVFNLHTSENWFTGNGIAIHNCRCVVRQVKEDEMTTTTNTAAGNMITTTFTTTFTRPGTAHPEIDDDPGEDDTGDDQDVDGEDYAELDSDVPWHGIIAPTGVMSGDRRKFAVDALRHRDLPLPVKFQKADAEGHGGAVVVANMTNIEERDGLIRAEGVFHTSPESSEAIGLVATQMLRGLSVDLDDATFELQYEDGSAFDMNDEDGDPIAVVTDGRIASVTLCSIPAFQEAYIALGTWADADADDATLAAAGCVPCAARQMDALYATWTAYAISEAAWDGSAARFTDEEYYRSCILHKNGDSTAKSDNSLPILEPNGDMNRAAVHAAAGRVEQVDANPEQKASAKRSLLTAYRKLEEDPPESLTAGAVFAPGTHDGPGWVTNPKETQRLRTYWTRGKGAAKIRWGQPGDFNRCRRQLAKYVPNPEYLAGTCANLHREAIGIWPGQEGGSGGRHSGATVTASAFTIVASGAGDLPDALWFTNPDLPGPTPLTIDGQHVYGHVAAWTSCHTGYGISVGDGEVCVRPPNSASNYAYFHTGQIETDAGKVNVGHITMDTGHAAASLAGRPAAAHYDNTGAVIADVVCGEDEHGIWFSGALRPQVSDTQRIALGAAALSGDWRRLGGNYELIAALCVNVPGFPIPRTAIAASADAGQYTLVAAGIVPPDTTPSLQDAIRTELALIRLEDARALLRAQTVARVHKLQVDHARGRLAAINHHHI